MALTASKLRENIYKILDQVAETGVPVEIVRKGKRLRLIADSPIDRKKTKLSRLLAHDVMKCEPDEIIHMDWSEEWKASEK
jgi:prevent-host-death family protein